MGRSLLQATRHNHVKAQVTDGWTTGERERYFGQLTSSGCVEPDLRSEAERIFDSERDLIEYRAFKVKESFRMKVARTWIDAHDGNLKPKHDRDMRTQRQIAIARIGQAPGDDAEGWGLLAVEHRILSELRAEYSAVELDARSDEELIEQRRTGESDEAQTRDEIRSQARRSQMLFGSRDEDERHQSEAESAAMRDEAHEKWVEDVTVENRAALKESLQRYFFEFAGDEAYTGESKFPMWVEVDGQWRLEKQTLTSIWNAELKKRGLEYKALWTLAKMVDSRYDAQVKYRRRVKKAAHNSELAA